MNRAQAYAECRESLAEIGLMIRMASVTEAKRETFLRKSFSILFCRHSTMAQLDTGEGKENT